MKKINIYLFCIGLMALGSCSDSFLDSEPVTTATDAGFYKTPNDAYAALVGCYDGLQVVWAGGASFPVVTTVLSDEGFAGGGVSDDYKYHMLDEFQKSRAPSVLNMYEDNWIAYYKAIYRCNFLLQKLDQVEWNGNESLRNTYESEARFLRAYLYFDMVRLWGNIPLLTEPSAENLEQANPDEVYKVIAEDLVFASENLEGDAPVDGRVSKWAAESLLGRVFLYYTGYYDKADLVGVVSKAEALAYLEDVITNGGFALVEDFAELWPAASLDDYAGEGNSETVFAIKYTYTSDYDGNTDGNHWMVMFGIRDANLFPYGQGWGYATVNPDLWNAYSNSDARKAASIISIDDEELPFEQQESQRDYTGFYVKKYAPRSYENGTSYPDSLGAENFMIGQFQDYVAMRYADVLLMAAELGSTNAQAYFDEVRKRAFGSDFTQVVVSEENIMRERRLEFAFEGIRYWDLLRQGIEVAAEAIKESTMVESGGELEEKIINPAGLVETKGLQQIPYTQITLSDGMLKQNTGW